MIQQGMTFSDLFSVVSLLVVFYFLGKMSYAQKSAREVSQIAFGAALWAVTEAKSLKNGAIIQRIIDRTQLVKDSSSMTEEAKVLAQQFEQALDGLEVKKKERAKSATIDPFQGMDPEDLV